MASVSAAALYARISSDQDGTGLGVARQLEDCRKLAARLGWPVGQEYVDNDISAYSGKRRPAFEQMLADIEAGDVDAVIVYHIDRLTRRPVELERFLAVLDAAKVRQVRFVAGDTDLSTGDGLMVVRILAAMAANESATKSRRIRRKIEQNVAAGLPNGGSHRPFGYEDDRITINEAEAQIIRQMVARYLAGESARSIAMWLQASGISTIAGKPWRTPTVSAIIQNPRIAGLRAHNGVTVGPAVWEGIIDAETHRRVLSLAKQKAVSGRRSPRRYLLSGMLRCGKCGTTLYSSARESTRRYVCAKGPDHEGCGRLTVVAEPVETLIASAVLHRLDTAELADALAGRAAKDAATAKVSQALAADQEQLGELAGAYADKLISMREWLEARKPIEARITLAEKRIARATRSDALAGLPGNGTALRESWDGLNLTRQAAIIGAVLDHAVITPGVNGARSLDPARVLPVWRL
jgi:DNA invertase Pin-like site-specific DNA recombinase